MKILLTGVAGFIGAASAKVLLERGDEIIGIDNMNEYYDPNLKKARLDQLTDYENFRFQKLDIADRDTFLKLCKESQPERILHLAAHQAGVRYSIENPHAYVDSNLLGFMHVLEGCREVGVEHLAYASSSSVYGANTKMPFSPKDPVDHPVSLYAATKRSNEIMAHCYSHLYGLPTTGLRFFTVYGPWGRPDMALFLFTEKILNGDPIQVFNYGRHRRDFTYIDDIVEGVVRVLDSTPKGDPTWDSALPDPSSSTAPFKIYNIGNSAPVLLTDFIDALEEALGKKAERELMPMAPGDVEETYADVTALSRDFGYKPQTDIKDGVGRFVAWYRDYYNTSP